MVCAASTLKGTLYTAVNNLVPILAGQWLYCFSDGAGYSVQVSFAQR
ncbi:hypothetical protein SAMN06265337_2143 [Hymenobacter gelipurpurascens]|uniref:Uncharacterized protein n=1 Tax=Hymenobacter gelipurpurascens TaxID=89968 RepID=A0A212TQ10_9BACT|nr:hypothetical protein SAMN06265337_2143 [Hymenobacter gelipurpurascens]